MTDARDPTAGLRDTSGPGDTTGPHDVICRPHYTWSTRRCVGLGAAGAVPAVAGPVYGGGLPWLWAGAGLLLLLMAAAAFYGSTALVYADAYGLHSRTLLRRRSVSWHNVADLRVHRKYTNLPNAHEARRVSLVLHDGRTRLLLLPQSVEAHPDPDFDAKLAALRAVHRRYGTPVSRHTPVVTHRTAGHGWAGWAAVCLVLLAGAGLAAWSVPGTAADQRAWQAAVPCTTVAPDAERRVVPPPEGGAVGGGECLATRFAVIERTEPKGPRQRSRLYFTGGRPVESVAVSREDALTFRPGDHVELLLWRGRVREVAGERHVWRSHTPTEGAQAVLAAVCALAAGYPGAKVLLRLRWRRLPDDEVLPSAAPFVGALAGTALWLLPLCYLHPTTLITSPVALAWAGAGSLTTLVLLGWAWRATRVRTPGEPDRAAATGKSGGEQGAEESEVFLAARFLDTTDYNPYRFGTHIALGGGPPAVVPGPGRFGAQRIPVERLTVTRVRRVRGDDGDTVPRSWHIAELDDAGTPVRLAAAPGDLARILRRAGLTPP